MEGKAFFLLRMTDHLKYLDKIEATLDGRGEFRGTDFHDCKLGQWLYNEGRQEVEAFGPEALALFERLLEPHQRFHEISHQAIRQREAGDSAASRAAISQMMRLSVQLVDTLLDLDAMAKRAMAKSTPSAA